MTRLLHIRTWIGIALIGLLLGINLAFGLSTANAFQSEVSIAVEPVHSIETSNWVSGYVQPSHGISAAAHFLTPPHKNPYQGFSAINKSPITFTSFIFLANPYFLHKIIVRLPHTDLIFPFHYFW